MESNKKSIICMISFICYWSQYIYASLEIKKNLPVSKVGMFSEDLCNVIR